MSAGFRGKELVGVLYSTASQIECDSGSAGYALLPCVFQSQRMDPLGCSLLGTLFLQEL